VEKIVEDVKTGLKQHDWRQWTMMPVVSMGILDSEGAPSVMQRPGADPVTKIFCMVCNTGLNPETAQTACPGEDDDDVPT